MIPDKVEVTLGRTVQGKAKFEFDRVDIKYGGTIKEGEDPQDAFDACYQEARAQLDATITA
ncbi:hypothetical protein LCGC14_3047780, partial [marine sediment metagenome]